MLNDQELKELTALINSLELFVRDEKCTSAETTDTDANIYAWIKSIITTGNPVDFSRNKIPELLKILCSPPNPSLDASLQTIITKIREFIVRQQAKPDDSAKPTNINDLPSEILTIIFQLLCLPGLDSPARSIWLARLVCTEWRTNIDTNIFSFNSPHFTLFREKITDYLFVQPRLTARSGIAGTIFLQQATTFLRQGCFNLISHDEILANCYANDRKRHILKPFHNIRSLHGVIVCELSCKKAQFQALVEAGKFEEAKSHIVALRGDLLQHLTHRNQHVELIEDARIPVHYDSATHTFVFLNDTQRNVIDTSAAKAATVGVIPPPTRQDRCNVM